MRVRDALLVEGSSRFAILCYGIFPVGELDLAFETLRSRKVTLNSRIHRFLGEGWPNGLVLNEIFVTNPEDISCTIAGAMSSMFEVGGTCLASACMYDGAFGDYDDLFAPETASQVYAFSLSEGEPLIVLDTSVLTSREWGSIIAGAHKRLG
jgi:hypothetical protein